MLLQNTGEKVCFAGNLLHPPKNIKWPLPKVMEQILKCFHSKLVFFHAYFQSLKKIPHVLHVFPACVQRNVKGIMDMAINDRIGNQEGMHRFLRVGNIIFCATKF